MSPRWATVADHGLYFYPNERHRRPHVHVMHGMQGAVLDVTTGMVLSGNLPPRVIRAVRALLEEYREEAIFAFNETIEHRFPGALEAKKEAGDE
jgi:hypothetical protein